jgi:hypothetical protein
MIKKAESMKLQILNLPKVREAKKWNLKERKN